MNKYGISEAKSSIGFKTYAVQNVASRTGKSLKGWLVRGAVFVSAFSMVLSVFTPVNATVVPTSPYGTDVMKKIVLCHWDASAKPDPAYKSSGNVAVSAAINGHGGHEDDIIPPFNHKDGFYPGLNWNTTTEEIWDDGNCGEETVPDPQTGFLTLVKEVVGSNDSPTLWDLEADGTDTIGPAPTGDPEITGAEVAVGEYTMSENGPTEGYTASVWSCVKETDSVPVTVQVTNGNTITINDDEDITCTITNTYEEDEEDPEVPNLHFIKVVCEEYSDVEGNNSADQRDDTGGKYTEFWNSPNWGTVDKPVNPTEIPKNCERANGWEFLLSTGVANDYEDQVDNLQTVGPTVNGEYVTDAYGENSDLNEALQNGIQNGSFWVSEVEQEGYGFAAIRCYNDALNGDNLEFINIGQSEVSDIYCIAYNVADEVVVPDCDDIVVSVDSVVAVDDDFGSCKISGYKYKDTDGSGTISEGDETLSGWEIYLNESNDCSYSDEAVEVTDVNGYYEFTNLDAGTYYVCERQQAGWDQVLPFEQQQEGPDLWSHTVVLTNADATNIDFLNEETPRVVCEEQELPSIILKTNLDSVFADIALPQVEDCSISGYKFSDLNSNGSLDEGDDGLFGWTIYLDLNNNNELDNNEPSTTTDANGYYEFTNLEAGTYTVREVNQVGWTQTGPDAEQGEYVVELVLSGAANRNFFNHFNSQEPCKEPVDVTVASSTSTQFEGSTTIAPSDLSDESQYPDGADGDTFVVSNGAWATIPGVDWVSESSVTPPAGPDVWRLYSHEFTIPAGSTDITTATLEYSADNRVTVFLDNVEIDSSLIDNTYSSIYSVALPALTPGTHTLEFAVQNIAWESENPTGITYKTFFSYVPECDDDNGGGGGGSRSSGSRDDDDGRVLGDSTGLPYKQPEVLGASTELPRTGTPISAILMLLASLGIILVPSAVKAKRSQE